MGDFFESVMVGIGRILMAGAGASLIAFLVLLLGWSLPNLDLWLGYHASDSEMFRYALNGLQWLTVFCMVALVILFLAAIGGYPKKKAKSS